ncbi:Rv3235 family protein [Amnibacterium flavum]|uniref:3-hydroxyacyl-CoA dehydrogenase n=1 Tax=Amnibacterium flavum TaxID=2173173 RepID=A0A2V1HY84_9MICO|nr:Rv3235 family protein [Amnibacterium flavum]PVZ96380.1 3-hydroxyacyl-CoA dehydrogenase [Amnibacterium flavum]
MPLPARTFALPADDLFAPQPTSSANLPDPTPLVENLSRSAIEILAGVRELEQIGRWVDENVYRHMLKRVVLSNRARALRGTTPRRPTVTIGTVRIDYPRDGVVEASVVVHGRQRSRAVALRLEGLDSRWRATALHVL